MADKIVIELTPLEAEILCGAIANHVPADRTHEVLLSMLYKRLEEKMQDFLKK